MKYMLLIHQGDAPTPRNEGWDRLSDEEKAAIGTDYREVSETPGVSPGLQLEEPETATTVRVTNGETLITDGPFAETKDLIAGWYVIDVDTYERAVALAGELSAAPGAGGRPIHEWLEVRPFLNAPPTVIE